MTSVYRNQSVLIPFRVWVVPETSLFRIELPCRDLTTPTEWKFNDRIERIPIWKRHDGTPPVLYGVNESVYPPTCKGADLYQFIQNDKYPFNTDYVVLGAYFESEGRKSTGFLKGRQVDQMFVFSYPVPDTKLLYFWAHIDMYNVLSYRMLVDPNINDIQTREATRGKYIHNSLYGLTTPGGYWRSTTESLCVPTHEASPHHFMTLRECQATTYPDIRNRHTWVGTNSEPLYRFMEWWYQQTVDQRLRSIIYQE